MRLLAWRVALVAPLWVAVPQAAAQEAAIDPASITVPSLTFKEASGDVAGYDKYFYFVRAETDFDTAYADLRECDGYARGLSARMGSGFPGTLGDAMSDAIWGGGQRREMRRLNLRTCMFYKGYRRFGLTRSIWVQFNFEEGNKAPTEEVRQRALMQQARIASGPMPATRELGR